MNDQSDQARADKRLFVEDAEGRRVKSEAAPQGLVNARVVVCPYCRSQDVSLLALFGAQLLTDQYYCNACYTPFEHVRDE